MRVRPQHSTVYRVGDQAPSMLVRFEDVTFDPTGATISFELVTWFGNVIQVEGAASLAGSVSSRTDAATGNVFFSFSLVYVWASDDLDTAGTYFGRFVLDVASLSGRQASLPQDQALIVRVEPAPADPEP